MRILSMHIENFLSFGKADFDLAEAGLVLVEGENYDDASARSNGSGKSAMIDALVWCLFGKTLRGYDHDEVVNRRVPGKDGCVVSVTVGDDTASAEFRVVRARRHPKLRSSLSVWVNGDDQSAGSAAETQEMVERLLGCSHRAFLSSVVFGQDRAYRFSALTDAEQKKVLDEVIGVERFADACSAARARVSAIQSDLQAAQRNLERSETSRDEAEAEAVDLRVKDTDFAEVQRGKIEAERAKLREVSDWLGRARKLHDVDALKAIVSNKLRELAEREREHDETVDAGSRARAAVSSWKARCADAVAELKRVRELRGECPTCRQEVGGDHAARAAAGLRLKLKSVRNELVEAESALDVASKRLAQTKRRLKEARDAIATAQKALNEGVSVEANAASRREERDRRQARITELEAEVSPYSDLVVKAEIRHEMHTKLAEQWSGEVAAIEAKLRLARFWVDAFGARGLRSLLVDTSLPLLNEEAARVSRAVTGGAISVTFSATSEQKSGKVVDRFEVRVDNRHGAGTYAGNSAGERAKVDLCVGLALQRLVASRSRATFNVAFFDEVFDHLDSAAHERVVGVLSELDKESVFVVSHDEDLKAWFPATLRIAKRGGFSTVDA